jgi:DICT domain-containing protein
MFEHALAAHGEAEADDLGQVAYVSRRDFDERTTFTFRAQVPCLEYVSLLIENQLLLRAVRTGRIYAGFEKLSRLEPIVDRYLRIADLSERVYVFGEADWHPPRHPNMQPVIVMPETLLAREWFVVVESSNLHVALVAVDESGWSSPVLEERNFRALVTHDPQIVARLAYRAEEFIDESVGV